MSIFINILVGVAFQIVGYMLTPKTKTELPAESDLDEPTVEAKPIPRIWGSVTIESPQLIAKWDKQMVKRKASTSKK